eukprot:7426788-Alexandrium_andersonii.AAC.1
MPTHDGFTNPHVSLSGLSGLLADEASASVSVSAPDTGGHRNRGGLRNGVLQLLPVDSAKRIPSRGHREDETALGGGRARHNRSNGAHASTRAPA